jgi:Replication-relaxation
MMRPACSRVAMDALLCIYQHRLMSTSQLHRLLVPDAARTTYLRHELARLRNGGLLDAVCSGSAREQLWFTTSAGAEQAEQSRQVIARPYRMTAERAAGPLRAHTLAVNEAGIAFAATARQRGDTCGPLDWIPEVDHVLGRGRHLICDALLSYVLEDQAAATRTQLQWFLELDRATMPVGRLAAKLAAYAGYAQLCRPGRDRIQAWRQRYPAFPRLLVVLTGASEAALERRAGDLAAAAAADGALHHVRLAAGVTTLGQLTEYGPFEPIVTRLGGPDVAECDALLRR